MYLRRDQQPGQRPLGPNLPPSPPPQAGQRPSGEAQRKLLLPGPTLEEKAAPRPESCRSGGRKWWLTRKRGGCSLFAKGPSRREQRTTGGGASYGALGAPSAFYPAPGRSAALPRAPPGRPWPPGPERRAAPRGGSPEAARRRQVPFRAPGRRAPAPRGSEFVSHSGLDKRRPARRPRRRRIT